jgi:hypothetical protein
MVTVVLEAAAGPVEPVQTHLELVDLQQEQLKL